MNRYVLDNWGARDAFPEETISRITQTADGFLWLLTPAGLVRFNGRRFADFGRTRLPGLECQRPLAILPASDGSLWLRCDGGTLWRHHDGSFERLSGDGQRKFAPVRVLRSDARKRIWIVTDDGVHRWENGRIRWDVRRLDKWSGRFLSFFVDGRDRLWLFLNDGGGPGSLTLEKPNVRGPFAGH